MRGEISGLVMYPNNRLFYIDNPLNSVRENIYEKYIFYICPVRTFD